MIYSPRFSGLSIFMLIMNISTFTFGNNFHPGSSNFAIGASINAQAPGDTITATISGDASACINTAQPVITFTANGGTPPYTFVYQINNGADKTTRPTPLGNNTITINAPTDLVGTFTYTLKSVQGATSAVSVISGTGAAIVTVNALPNIDFSFTNNNTCSGTPVQFTPSLTGAYAYAWNFGDSFNSTASNPSHLFEVFGSGGTQTFNVKLTITDSLTNCQNTVTKAITVNKGPDASLDTLGNNIDETYYDVNQHIFSNCSATRTSPQYDFVAINASSTSASNTGYLIDWGDGNSNSLPSTYTSFTH